MLVIRRHAGQTILIGEEVEIVVIECGQGRVKLGIRAHKQIPVLRGEVLLTRQENLEAARALRSGPSFAIPSEFTTVVPVQGLEDRTDKHL